MNDLKQLARDLNDRCRLQGTFTLRSGQMTSEYFDKYLFESDPTMLLRIATEMRALLPTNAQVLGGMELGGVPLVTMLSQVTGLPALFVRKTAKSYGTCRQVEGPDPEGATVVLIEDVVTSGGSLLRAAAALRKLEVPVTTAVCVIDRSPPNSDSLAEHGIHLVALFTQAQLDAAA